LQALPAARMGGRRGHAIDTEAQAICLLAKPCTGDLSAHAITGLRRRNTWVHNGRVSSRANIPSHGRTQEAEQALGCLRRAGVASVEGGAALTNNQRCADWSVRRRNSSDAITTTASYPCTVVLRGELDPALCRKRGRPTSAPPSGRPTSRSHFPHAPQARGGAGSSICYVWPRCDYPKDSPRGSVDWTRSC